jgi:lysophospholipase L1-like esterase
MRPPPREWFDDAVIRAPAAAKRPLVAVVLAGALLMGFGGTEAFGSQLLCKATCTVSESGGAQHRHSVAVVGDSITYMSSKYIRSSLRAYHYAIDATTGQNMAQMYPAIQQLLPTSPDTWVVELGTNDARTLSDWTSAFSQEVTTLAAQPCVVLVSVNPRINSTATAIDDAMSRAALGHSNFHVLDWGNIEWQKPQWVGPDGIHPGPQGSAELAKMMRLAVHHDC